jgi:hypothetical protein
MTRSNIGGVLDGAALGRLHFHALSSDEQRAAIRKMADAGDGDHTIASATGLSVEFIRQILAERLI